MPIHPEWTIAPQVFDWDDGNRKKCQKHGISIGEIETFFARVPMVAPDDKHSESEKRLIAIGRSSQGRPMFVAFTLRDRHGERLIRPISARYMHLKEIEWYEKKGSEVRD